MKNPQLIRISLGFYDSMVRSLCEVYSNGNYRFNCYHAFNVTRTNHFDMSMCNPHKVVIRTRKLLRASDRITLDEEKGD